MTVESATYISQLNAANPSASDNINEGDDHLRLIKNVLKTQFPNIGASAVNPTATQFNKLGFETGAIIMFASNTAPTTQTISGDTCRRKNQIVFGFALLGTFPARTITLFARTAPITVALKPTAEALFASAFNMIPRQFFNEARRQAGLPLAVNTA